MSWKKKEFEDIKDFRIDFILYSRQLLMYLYHVQFSILNVCGINCHKKNRVGLGLEFGTVRLDFVLETCFSFCFYICFGWSCFPARDAVSCKKNTCGGKKILGTCWRQLLMYLYNVLLFVMFLFLFFSFGCSCFLSRAPAQVVGSRVELGFQGDA
jgi:hypothetical protein